MQRHPDSRDILGVEYDNERSIPNNHSFGMNLLVIQIDQIQ